MEKADRENLFTQMESLAAGLQTEYLLGGRPENDLFFVDMATEDAVLFTYH